MEPRRCWGSGRRASQRTRTPNRTYVAPLPRRSRAPLRGSRRSALTGRRLTVWLRFALGQRRVARTRNPWMSRGVCRSAAAAHRAWMTRSDPEARSARLQASSEDSLSTIDSPPPRLCQEVPLFGVLGCALIVWMTCIGGALRRDLRLYQRRQDCRVAPSCSTSDKPRGQTLTSSCPNN